MPGVGSVFLSGGQIARHQHPGRHRQAGVVRPVDRGRPPGPGQSKSRGARRPRPARVARAGACARWAASRRPTSFNELIVANRKGYPIRIKDIGRAEDSIEEPRGLSRLDGQKAVSLFVQKQSGTNTVQISDAVQARLAKISQALPPDIKIEITQDQSRFIRESMQEVKFHLLLAAVLVSGTILLFIRDWRTTLIATLAIPTSIIPTFLFMKYMGFTLNNITMLGLILAIGIVIDDAVVVHENIFRHMEEDGLDAMTAAARRHPRNRPGRAGHQPLAGRHLRAGRLHGRHGRPVLQQLRTDRGLRHRHEPVRFVHADADALFALSEARTGAMPATPSRRTAGSTA